MFVDTHCHISGEYYSDIDKVIKEDIEALVDKIIISGCSHDSIKESLYIASKYSNIYVTIGYHPEEVGNVSDEDLKELEELVNNNKKIVGIGEIGLDYYYTKDNKEEQITLFRKQLVLAEKLNLPVVIHSRDAVEDTINCLRDYKVHGIIHCFGGSYEVAKIYIKMDFLLGIGGVITFSNSKLGEVVKKLDLKNIVLETDSPYLSPVPYRGKTNSSKNIPIIAEYISNLFETDIKTVAEITSKNAKSVFDLH